MSYCRYVQNLAADDLHKVYHDTQYGFPLASDNALFERLVLEINQAGLSWTTILKKKDHFHQAYDGFDIATVAAYGAEATTRLLADAGIIRNRLKVAAAIHNAQVMLGLQRDFGSFRQWLAGQNFAALTKEERVKIFKKTFTFTGGEIVNEFLMSCGLVPGAHDVDCPIGLQLATSVL